MCCGSKRSAARAAAVAGRNAAAAPVGPRGPTASSVTMFEYVGKGETWIRGAVSGQVYTFRRQGDRVRVDPRDSPSLAALPSLRSVR